jgi:hypothetical protein
MEAPNKICYSCQDGYTKEDAETGYSYRPTKPKRRQLKRTRKRRLEDY